MECKAKDFSVVQADVNEWYEMTWKSIPAKSVEPYKMDERLGYKSFDILLQNNKKLNFYRIQESPELLLFRKDEGMLYHFPSDLGFTMLNPHVQQKEEKVMPELPEVEVTRIGLKPLLKKDIEKVVIRNYSLRWPINSGLPELLKNQTLLDLSRRGKYILAKFNSGTLIIHLGMSGRLCIVSADEVIK